MEKLLERLEKSGIAYERNCPLSRYSTFHIGGMADLVVFARTRSVLIDTLELLHTAEIPFCVIGRGSNVVFADDGYRGAIVLTAGQEPIEINGTEMTVGAGTSLSAIALAARDASLAGAAFAYGIPGTLGGAVYMNAGAYGGCMADICLSSDYYDRENGSIGTFKGKAHIFGYRTSIYAQSDRYVILGARLGLKRGDRNAIAADMEDFMARRKRTQPLDFPSAGSVFKRPNGYFAGKLIEECGLKGLRVGGAQVSEKHAGFIINRGNATAHDVKALAEQIRTCVKRETGVDLECEIRFL